MPAGKFEWIISSVLNFILYQNEEKTSGAICPRWGSESRWVYQGKMSSFFEEFLDNAGRIHMQGLLLGPCPSNF